MLKRILLIALISMGANQAFCALGNPTLKIQDQVGSGAQAIPTTKLWVYGTVSEAVTTQQVGGWIDCTGTAGFTAEIIQGLSSPVTAGTGYVGSYQIQVSNDQTNIYTSWQDNNPTIPQVTDYVYRNRNGWKYVRVVASPTTGNTGVLNVQVKTFGADNMKTADVNEGIVDLGPQTIGLTALASAAVTAQSDFKIPSNYQGVEFWINCTAITGTSFTPTFWKKDPVSGLYISIGTGVAVTTTGITVVKLARGLTAAGGIFTDSINPNMGVSYAVSSLTSAAFTITAVPTK